jgi:hypothetical protein
MSAHPEGGCDANNCESLPIKEYHAIHSFVAPDPDEKLAERPDVEPGFNRKEADRLIKENDQLIQYLEGIGMQAGNLHTARHEHFFDMMVEWDIIPKAVWDLMELKWNQSLNGDLRTARQQAQEMIEQQNRERARQVLLQGTNVNPASLKRPRG